MNTRMPATSKGEATRGFLLRTAAEVFAERGYAATTLNDLIAASGLTKGAFYFHFRSKAELATAVLHDQESRWHRHVAEELEALPAGRDRLAATVPAMLALIAAEPAAWSLTRLTHELASDPALAGEVVKPMARRVELVAGTVRDGQRLGQFRSDVEAGQVAAVLVGAFDGLKSISTVLDGGPDDAFPARARAMGDLLMAGLEITPA